MTSLIDVIFLLLLFFMLSSTFSRFSEVRLATGGLGGEASKAELLFLRVASDALGLNGQPVPLDGLRDRLAQGQGARAVVVSLAQGTDAQRLVDVLVALRGLPDVAVTVLEASS